MARVYRILCPVIFGLALSVLPAACSGGSDNGQTTGPPEPSPNEAPTANLSHRPSQPEVGETVTFDASGSSDSDGSVVEYAWDFDGNGTVDRTTSGATVGHSYSEAADYGATVTVEDDAGATDEASTTVSVNEVDPEAAPVINSVSPDVLKEGGAATIEGENFAAAASGNTVSIDGLEATVTAAAEDELTVDVPLYDCLPVREVTVEVETSAGSTSAGAELTPDESPVDLSVGSGSIVFEPGSFCLQFEKTSADEGYLILAQSMSSTVGSVTPVRVTSEAANGSGAASVSPVSLAANVRIFSGGGQSIRIPEWLEDHREVERRIRRWERRNVGPETVVQPGGPPVASRVGGDVEVGDPVQIRVPDLSSGEPCETFTEIDATVRSVGNTAILVSDDENPSGGFSDGDYQTFSDRLDNDILATQLDYFGAPTDIDNNGHVVVVVTKELNRTVPSTLGFVTATDLNDRSDCSTSDEGEFFYAKAPDPNGTYGSDYATEDARDRMPFIMAHELTHVIQQTRRLLSGKTWMDSWLAEAQATLSEEVVGHEVTGRTPRQNYGFTVARNSDGSDEVDWYWNAFVDLVTYYGFKDQNNRVEEAPDQCGWWRGDPSPCLGRAKWYGVGWTFLRWLSDHWGPTYSGGEEALHREIVDADANGWQTISEVTGESFESLAAAWAASLYVDDRIAGTTDVLTIPSWDLFDVEQNVVSTAHLKPFEAPFGDWQAVGEIRASSAGYVTVDGSDRPATAIRVRGSNGGTLPSYMQLIVVRLQ